MEIKLAVQSGGRIERTIPIADGDFLIGRDLACQFPINHERVSHHHCRIRRKGTRVVVEDLNSMQGTLVNDQRVRKADIHDGDRLKIGPATFVFQIGEAVEELRARGGRQDASANLVPRAISTNPLDSTFETPATLSARQLLARMSGQHDVSEIRRGVRIVEHEGIGVVRLLEEAIVEDDAVRRIGQEVRNLIAAGRPHIVLDLEAVQTLSIQAVGMMAEARDLCQTSGGLMKLCKLGPSVSHALTLMGLDGQFDITLDEPTALKGYWPGLTPASTPEPAPVAAPTSARLRLIVLLGKARGKAIEVERSKFVIGRDPTCQLRPNSPAISRLHTVIERRDGRVFVRDLGGKNGTLHNGHLLSGEEVEIVHGDQIQIGPLAFGIALGDREFALAAPDESGASGTSWLVGGEQDEPPPSATLLMDRPILHHDLAAPAPPREPLRPIVDTPAPIRDLAYEVIDDVLKITILPADLNDEPEVGPVRYQLLVLSERPAMPNRVVIDLGRVKYLSSRAVGVLLAHFQRITRAGGAMRLCCVHPNIATVLDQMRVPMLLDIFPTAEEALGEPWE